MPNSTSVICFNKLEKNYGSLTHYRPGYFAAIFRGFTRAEEAGSIGYWLVTIVIKAEITVFSKKKKETLPIEESPVA